MPNPVLTCTAYDATSGTCTAQAWVEPPTLLPLLSAEDGLVIAGKMLGAFVLAYCIRELVRAARGGK